jgi:hypothetical protein
MQSAALCSLVLLLHYTRAKAVERVDEASGVLAATTSATRDSRGCGALQEYTEPLLENEAEPGPEAGRAGSCVTIAPAATAPASSPPALFPVRASSVPTSRSSGATTRASQRGGGAVTLSIGLASVSAFCAALLLILWAVIAPCVISLLLEIVGCAAMLCAPCWTFAPAIATPTLAAKAGALAPFLPGSAWMLASQVLVVLWLLTQYAVAATTSFIDSETLCFPSNLARVGLGSCPPHPALLPSSVPQASRLAFSMALQQLLTSLLAICVNVHRNATRRILSESVVEPIDAVTGRTTDQAAEPRLDSSGEGAALDARQTTTARGADWSSWIRTASLMLEANAPEWHRTLVVTWARIIWPTRRFGRGLLTSARQLALWHLDKLPMLMVLLAGVYAMDLLHFGWLLLFLVLGGSSPSGRRFCWPALLLYSVVVLILQTSWLVFSPAVDSQELPISATLIGLNPLSTDLDDLPHACGRSRFHELWVTAQPCPARNVCLSQPP